MNKEEKREELNIENLRALVGGMGLNIYQKAQAREEFKHLEDKVIEYQDLVSNVEHETEHNQEGAKRLYLENKELKARIIDLEKLKNWIMTAQVAAEQGECLMPNVTDVLNEIERLQALSIANVVGM